MRERWLRTQAEEDASFADVLVDLAERGSEATLRTVGGRAHTGRVLSVGRDFVAVRTATAPLTLLPLAMVAVVTVVTEPPASPSGGPGPALDEGSGGADGYGDHSTATGLADVLAQAAGHRPRLSVDVAGQQLVGELRSVGRDLITLRPTDRPGLAFVTLQSVSAISFLDSG